MRSNWWKIMGMVLLLSAVACWSTATAGEMAKEEKGLTEPPQLPKGPMQGRQFEMSDEHIEQILAQIRQTDPQKADELVQLREHDPEAFKAEIRKIAREHFMNRMRAPGRRQPGRPGEMMGPGIRERMEKKQDEYVNWLTENFPDEAAKLERLKEENPNRYNRAVAISMRKYLPMFRAKDNPQLAEALKEGMALREKRMELLGQIKTATDDQQKKALTAELQQVVGKQYDLIVLRKELAYEDLAKKLQELQKELDTKKAEVEKWKNIDFKNKQVKQRVDELVNNTEKFEWD